MTPAACPHLPPPACAYPWGEKGAALQATDWGSALCFLSLCFPYGLAQQCWIRRCLRKGQWPHLKVARKEAEWKGLLMLERFFLVHVREVWGKETAQRRPWTRQIVLGRLCRVPKATSWVIMGVLAIKVGLKCTIACSTSSYFAFANLKNKISYLFSLTRTDREKSSFPGFVLDLHFAGKYFQGQKLSLFSAAENLTVFTIYQNKNSAGGKNAQKLRWESFFFTLKTIIQYSCIELLLHFPHALIHQISTQCTVWRKKLKTKPPIFNLIKGLLL